MKPDSRHHFSVDRAIGRYAAALRQGKTPCRADGQVARQTDNFQYAFMRTDLRYAQIKEVLCDAGIQTCMFVMYRSFGLHVDKLCRDYSGESLRLRALDAVLRWRCYGCNPEILRAITRTVFGLDLPSPSESCKP
jgi:hypothetical protein